jgi:hypothetical protein
MLVLASLACAGSSACGEDARTPSPPAAPTSDPYAPPIPIPPVSGEPMTVRHDLSGGLVLRSTGTLAFRFTASGSFGKTAKQPSRSLEGTVDLVRRVEPLGGAQHSTVTGTLALASRVEGAPPVPTTVPFKLSFDEDGRGGAIRRTIRVSASGVELSDLEGLQRAFTDRFAPPDRSVRVGDRFTPAEGMDVEDPLKRTVFLLFRRSLAGGTPMVPAPTGAVWAAAREGSGADVAVVLRAAIAHFHEGDTDPPPLPKENVHIVYEAAIEGTRNVVLDGGWASAHDVTLRRRIRFTSADADYTVEVEARTALTTKRER